MAGPREGDPMTRLDRRTFMRAAAAGAAVTASGGLRLPNASASTRSKAYRGPRATRVLPSLTQAGPELALPAGFTYKTFAAFGSAMSDGFITPPIHDGMGVFDQPGGGYRIVRNLRPATRTTTSQEPFSAIPRRRMTRRRPADASRSC